VIQDVESKEPVYVLPVFLKPGKHSFLVSSFESLASDHLDHILQTAIVQVREEPIPPFTKARTAKGKVVGPVRVFQKENSVFKKWI